MNEEEKVKFVIGALFLVNNSIIPADIINVIQGICHCNRRNAVKKYEDLHIKDFIGYYRVTLKKGNAFNKEFKVILNNLMEAFAL